MTYRAAYTSPPPCAKCEALTQALYECQAGATELDAERHALAKRHDELIDALAEAHDLIGRNFAENRLRWTLAGKPRHPALDPSPLHPARVYVGVYALAASLQWVGFAAASGVNLRPSHGPSTHGLRYR